MNNKFKKILYALSLFLISSPSYAVVAGGIVAINHTWPAYSEFDKLTFFQKINNDGGPKSRYYWANQFYFQQGHVGYIGLQNNGNGVHSFNFSIWDAKKWKSGSCHLFSHEGSGVQCHIKVPWKIGHQYKIDVSKKGNLVTGTVTDLLNGKTTIVGVIEVPNTFGKLYASLGFVEEYSQGADELSSCFAMGPQSSIFSNPIGDGKVKATQSTYSYGNCNDHRLVQTTCNDEACTNTINLDGIAPSNTFEVPLINGRDIRVQTLSNALKKEDLVAIHSYDGHWAQNIFFPKPGAFKWKSIFVHHGASYNSSIHVNNGVTTIKKGQSLMYQSDGKSWKIITTR
ncbi:DUF3472 domain-containing protein [Bartonella heixiaziensis]|uniref:DUF3472 domain-containing protein n=1 Tax=Bartonella heixiaziensis TaxID=1461000 RepID=UPI003D24E3B5